MSISLAPLSPRTFAQTDLGRYVDEATTGDEPIRISVDSKTNQSGLVQAVVRQDTYKNGVESDSVLTTYVVIKGNLNDFTDAEIAASVGDVQALVDSGNLARIRRGER